MPLPYNLEENPYFHQDIILSEQILKQRRPMIIKYWLIEVMKRLENHIIPENSLLCDIALFYSVGKYLKLNDSHFSFISQQIKNVEYLNFDDKDFELIKNAFRIIHCERNRILEKLLKEGNVKKTKTYGFDSLGNYGKYFEYTLNTNKNIPVHKGINDTQEW